MQHPKLILLDEIGAGVNRALLNKIADKISQLNKEQGYTFCLIEHDLDYVTFLTWVMLIAGGSGNNRGAIVGAWAIWAIWSMTEILTSQLPTEWATRPAYLRMLLIGIFLQLVLQRFRSGLLPEKSLGTNYTP